jgi:hypothetical protein
MPVAARTEPAPCTVLFCAHSQYRAIHQGTLKRFKRDYGAEIHLYAASAQEVDYYRRNDTDGLFSSITAANVLYEACARPVGNVAAVVARARELEQELGLTFNELALTDRHLGRGYSLGGFGHPRSRTSEETSYPQMLAGLTAQVEFWQREIETRRPSLVLQPGKALAVIARKAGVATRTLAASRYKNYYYWATDELFSHPPLKEAFQRAASDPELTIAAPYASHLPFREKFRRDAALHRTVGTMGRLALMHGYWHLRGYEKAKGYHLHENMRLIWRKSRDIQRLTSSSMPGLDSLGGQPYVFFPLATEPETALQILSPEYFFQLETIAAVARDLPAGVLLAVKEHFAAAGRRPKDFYGQIREFKNVRLIDMAEFGLEAVRRAAAVVTITGTSGFEGAALGRPVIAFGRHNLYGFLPHVSVIRSLDELKPALATALSPRFDAERARSDGSRFLRAIIDTSFDLESFQPIKPTVASPAAIEAAYLALVEGLDLDRPADRSSLIRHLSETA